MPAHSSDTESVDVGELELLGAELFSDAPPLAKRRLCTGEATWDGGCVAWDGEPLEELWGPFETALASRETDQNDLMSTCTKSSSSCASSSETTRGRKRERNVIVMVECEVPGRGTVVVEATPVHVDPEMVATPGYEFTYRCGYCATLKKSSSTTDEGRVRIRCGCGGKHQDGKPRMHANWDPVASQPGGPVPALGNARRKPLLKARL